MSLLSKSFVFLFCLLCGCNGSVDKEIKEQIMSEYNALPDKLKNECKSIVLCDPEHFEYKQEIVDGSHTKDSITLLVDSCTKSIKDYKML